MTTLDRYRNPNMVVLRPSASVYDAARAMAEAQVGAILVGEQHRIVGIVTDRDLVLDVIGGDLDARETPLEEVVSEDVAAIDVGATVDDAAQLMQARGCRRLPITEDGRVVGMVTLDDLVLQGALTVEAIAAIVRSQLELAAQWRDGNGAYGSHVGRGASLKRALRARTRHDGRAAATYGHMLHALYDAVHLGSKEKAELGLQIVLEAICRRLSPADAEQLLAQLPSKLRERLSGASVGPDKRVTSEVIQAELQTRLGLDRSDAQRVLSSTCKVIADKLSTGQVEAVREHLPASMKGLFPGN